MDFTWDWLGVLAAPRHYGRRLGARSCWSDELDRGVLATRYEVTERGSARRCARRVIVFKLPRSAGRRCLSVRFPMAVYTEVGDTEDLEAFLARIRHRPGSIRLQGNRRGRREHATFSSTTTGGLNGPGQYIVTLYEKRVDAGDLPFFLQLLDHLADRGLPVPRAIRDRAGVQVQQVCGRPACLIEFLHGVSVSHPTPTQARAAGEALGRMHAALADFTPERPNSLGLEGWHTLATRCDGDLDAIAPGLAARVADELAFLDARWPADLPKSVIHADLFPDNMLMRGDAVGGIIDFYFACTEIRAWDVAVTHAAWCFEADGTGYHADLGAALIAGYDAAFGLSEAERAAFATLARGAALRFLLTRAYDWINTPADALVTRKDPLAFLRRLDFYAQASAIELFGA